jgi:predicted RNase H-like HicB family nuclease
MNHKIEDDKLEIRHLSDANGGDSLTLFPESSGCMGDGETPEAARQDARDDFEACIEARVALSLPMPKLGVRVSGKLLAEGMGSGFLDDVQVRAD